ncbi:YibE/F family protein [Phycicoccus sp. CMS6Z-2]|uniref:YibE/F family protein n=2 Tax=Phycicoccus flavus TaxID=2502783 RepID=A0A8T6R1Z4_9MICO|nr:YibE/F family protein [Phycicoccus flavus]
MTRIAWVVLVPLAVLTLVGLVVLWPSGAPAATERSSAVEYDGVVLSVSEEACPPTVPDPAAQCGTVSVRIDTPEGSRDVEAPLSGNPGAPDLEAGDEVVVAAAETPDGFLYGVVDHQRGTGLVVLLAALAVALLVFGRWRGLSALVGLAITFVALFVFIVPAVIGGESPVLVALVGASFVTLSVLYLTHGVSLTTTVAVMGTMASLGLTAALSELAVGALRLTGVTDDISTAVATNYGVDTRGLLVASTIIGSVGVLDDVTVTQAATVAEVGRANPTYRFTELYGAGSRVGRSHIASVVNTIVLAYAGSSLPLLVLVVADNGSLTGAATTQLISQEVVRSAVATIGLIAAVPLTTALAALATRTAPTTTPTAHDDGRSGGPSDTDPTGPADDRPHPTTRREAREAREASGH